MTDDELRAIEARANAATPGPWFPADWGRIEAGVDGPSVTEAADRPGDNAFIAAARSDVPALVAEVRRLRDELAKATARPDCDSCGVQLGAIWSCARCDS